MSSALRYEPQLWNKDVERRKARNCYAYFLQDLRNSDGDSRDSFPHPGAWATLFKEQTNVESLIVGEPYTCRALQRAILADNPQIVRSSRRARCAPGYYKGFAAVDPDADDGDFHFWVEHSDKGFWSHKPGSLDVTNLDADGRLIHDPSEAARGRYSVACGYFCVPHNRQASTRSAARPPRTAATHND